MYLSSNNALREWFYSWEKPHSLFCFVLLNVKIWALGFLTTSVTCATVVSAYVSKSFLYFYQILFASFLWLQLCFESCWVRLSDFYTEPSNGMKIIHVSDGDLELKVLPTHGSEPKIEIRKSFSMSIREKRINRACTQKIIRAILPVINFPEYLIFLLHLHRIAKNLVLMIC